MTNDSAPDLAAAEAIPAETTPPAPPASPPARTSRLLSFSCGSFLLLILLGTSLGIETRLDLVHSSAIMRRELRATRPAAPFAGMMRLIRRISASQGMHPSATRQGERG